MVIMSGENVLKFLVTEEVFESYGTEVQLKEIMETGQTETEMVAYMGQFLLMKFMDQNEEIQSLRSILSEQDQEMKYVKEKQRYMNTVDTNYKAMLRDMEIEKEELEKMNYACQKELKRLQQKLSRLSDTDTLLRKSIFELAEYRSVQAIQAETLKNLPIRDHCLLCLNPKDHNDIHNKLNDDLLSRLGSAQKRLAGLELSVEAENRKKKILDEKLIALRKEVDALTQYLKWSGRAGENNTPCGSVEIIETSHIQTSEYDKQELESSVVNCDDSVQRAERNMNECETREKVKESNLGKSYRISERTILQISDRTSSDLINGAVSRTQKCWMSNSDEKLQFNKRIEMSEVVLPHCDDSDNSDDVIRLNTLTQGKQENHPQNEKEIQNAKPEVDPCYERKIQEPETLQRANTQQNYDDVDMHCSLCVVDGRCQACKAMQEKNIGCFRELFKRIIDLVRAVLNDK